MSVQCHKAAGGAKLNTFLRSQRFVIALEGERDVENLEDSVSSRGEGMGESGSLAKWQVTEPCYLPLVLADNILSPPRSLTTVIQIVK